MKVIDLATVIAAPSTAAMLADFGAEVIKVEAPGGDAWRWADGHAVLPFPAATYCMTV